MVKGTRVRLRQPGLSHITGRKHVKPGTPGIMVAQTYYKFTIGV